MYQTKQRLNAFGQPNFLQKKEQTNTFWNDEEVIPFKLSVPEYFSPPPLNIFDQKPKNNSISKNIRPRTYDNYRTNREHQKQTIQRPTQSFRPLTKRQHESYIYDRPYSTLQGYCAQKIYTNWIEKELYFSMSKLSFLVLVVGLFFLSSLLFVTGFLVAVNIYDIGSLKSNQNYTMNLPSTETPHIPTPSLPVPVITGQNQIALNTPPAPTLFQMQPTAPNPHIMKSGTHGSQMADVPISNADMAHVPSAYAQLPTQPLPPVPQQIPQSGAYYASPQQQPSMVHAPSANYIAQQPQAPIQSTVQPPMQQQYAYAPQNVPQGNHQNYSIQTNEPAPQPYNPTYQSAAPYNTINPRA